MENLKQEAIKKAYGKSWEDVKSFVRKDGSLPENLYTKYCKNIPCIDYSTGYLIPETIYGIENNRGWIRIENEKDLPKEVGEYHIVRYGKVKNGNYIGKNRWFVNNNDYPKTTELHGITHYQEMTELQLPIY